MTTRALWSRPPTLAAAIAIACSLAACNKQTDDGQTVGQKVDAAMERAESAANNAKNEAREATHDIRNQTRSASDKVADAAVTASVNADLAKDPDLSALKINVDTSNGHVTLHGSAPSDAARQRATQLASSVKGVTSVDNELSVQK